MVLTYECGDVLDGEDTVQGKQAKIVSPTQERAILGYLETTRYPHRDRVMFLLSMKAGLRAKEMAALTWAMVTDAAGQIGEAIHLQNRASKGQTGGRASIMASATPFCFCTTQKHLTIKIVIISMTYDIQPPILL